MSTPTRSEWSYYEYNGGVNAVVTMTEATPGHKLLWGTTARAEIFTGSAITSRRMWPMRCNDASIPCSLPRETQDSLADAFLQERREAFGMSHRRLTQRGKSYVHVKAMRSLALRRELCYSGDRGLSAAKVITMERSQAAVGSGCRRGKQILLAEHRRKSAFLGSSVPVISLCGEVICLAHRPALHPLLGALTLAVESHAPEDWIVHREV